MRFSVRHQTAYRYSAPVRLSPHLLRFNPRPDAGRLVKRDLAIHPEPKRRQETVDRFGNLVTRIDFDGLSEVFSIESRFELDVAFAPAQASAALPALPWPRDAGGPNAAYLAAAEIDGALRAFALKLATACAGAPLAFLDRLNETLFTQIRHDIRPEGPARPAEETLKLGHGACRDLPEPRRAGPVRERLSGPCGYARRATTSPRLARGVRSGARLARLRSDPWACRVRRTCRTRGGPRSGPDHARRGRVHWRGRLLDPEL